MVEILIFNIFQVSPISEFCSFQICRTEIGNFVKTQTQGSQDWIRINFYIILDIRSAGNQTSQVDGTFTITGLVSQISYIILYIIIYQYT